MTKTDISPIKGIDCPKVTKTITKKIGRIFESLIYEKVL
jgi:hypothetical protein